MGSVGGGRDGSGNISHIKDLTPDPENTRKHNPRNIGVIVDALNEVGAARSIVIDEHGRVLAGNGTIEAAAQAGIERVRVVDADGHEIIAVRRKNLSEEDKRKLSLYDNRAAELAEWDVELMQRIASESPKLLEKMFYANEIESLLAAARGVDGSTQAEESENKGLRQLIVSLTQEQYARVDKILERLVESKVEGASPHAEGNALFHVFSDFDVRHPVVDQDA